MATIKPYTDQIAAAVYGEEVRGSIINALNAVNDDNNSYTQIKQDILDAKTTVDNQVTSFDDKVAAANTAKTNLEAATSAANTAKTNLEAATSAANTATSAANTATSAANTAKTNLEAATSAANTAKTNLTTAKTNAEAALSNLNQATATAATSKTNLDSTISDASAAKSQLQTVIDNADTIKGQLSSTIANATDAKTALDLSIQIAAALNTSLTDQNSSASTKLIALNTAIGNADEILTGVDDIKAYLGYTDNDIVGICVDYENKTFKRLAGAYGKTSGASFDDFTMFGGRKRCNVADNGTINAYYGDAGYAENGSNGQVMVYQPKFYYKVVPLKIDVNTGGIGYHLRKANYYVSTRAKSGFSLHPAFYDANGHAVNYILLSAYEACLWDANGGSNGLGGYILDDAQVMTVASDKLCSISGAKPASGYTQNLTRPNIEQMAQNRGSGWHGDLIKAEAANQLLMLIELGSFNAQTIIEKGVVSISDNGLSNCSSLTGSTASLGNTTGNATYTTNEINDDQVIYGVNGKRAISYRGMENPWGNIYKLVYGINVWGNGSMAGGQPYICSDYLFSESKNTGNYVAAGFTLANAGGYASAMGYSETCDWLFFPSECNGSSNLPVGDIFYILANQNGYRISLLGGDWLMSDDAGEYCWQAYYGVGSRSRNMGSRLVYVPTASV